MRRAVIAATALLLTAPMVLRAEVHPKVLQAEAQRVAAMEKAKKSVLAVFGVTGKGGGSGVVISPDGYALTNFHVVKPCGNAMKCGMANGKAYDAVVVGVDPVGDVALIKLFGRDEFPYAELADSDKVRPGDWCFAMGNPFLLATDFQPTVTYGIVSGVNRYQYPAGTLLEYADCIQTDASINPGNSGGPLFDMQSRVIGINGRGSFEKRGRVNVGVAYAISINQIKNFLGYLHSGRIVDHATLGAVVVTSPDGEVVVNDILDTSDAYRRGLRFDDEIVAFGGRVITTTNGLKNALGIFPKGWRVPLSFRRDGNRYDVLVRLAGVHGEGELLEKLGGRRRQIMPMPLPEKDKDGDKPDNEKRDDDDNDKPKEAEQPKSDRPGRLPHGIPARLLKREPPMAEIVKQHFEEKKGFANYYFNKLHRDRVLKAWKSLGDFSQLGGRWILAGELAGGGGAFSFELTDNQGTLKLPVGEPKRWTATDNYAENLLPEMSGGLLPTLNLWRRLATVVPGKFGDLTYLGTAPLVGYDQHCDVLVGLYKGVECHFYFDPTTGHLLALEMFSDESSDPCEVYFRNYREVDGRQMPGEMEVRFGDDLYGMFNFQTIETYR